MEMFSRGFVYTFLRNNFYRDDALALSSYLFILNYPISMGGSIGYFLVGIILAYLYEKKGSIIPCIIAHSFVNLVIVLGGILFKCD
jgi:membrane protease YdiL (CAAX protease family)